MTEAASVAVAQSFLTVKVGDERFAVPASDVAEVIRPPAVTRVPLGPKSLVGVANLRGAVMPVVSLRALLGTEGEPPVSPRVIVIDRGSPVGLVIDEVTALGAVDGVGETDRPDDGAPARLINLDGLLARDFGSLVRRARQGQSSSLAGHEQETTAVDEEALVSFDVAGQDFALPLESVREVVAVPTGIAA